MSEIRAFTFLAFLALPAILPAQGKPTSPSLRQGRVEGSLPSVLKLHYQSASADVAGLAALGPRQPTRVAPSARAYGNSEFTALPSRLSFFAGLNERSGSGSRTLLPALDVRFVSGASFLMALDTTRREVLVGPSMARKLGIAAGDGDLTVLPPFRLGAIAFDGIPARRANSDELPRDSVDGVLPLVLLRGFRIRWEPKAGRLTLDAEGSNPGEAPGAGAFVVHCQWPEGALCLSVSLQDRVTGLMVLDASAMRSLFDLTAAQRAGLPFRPWADVRRNEILKGGLAEQARLRIGQAEVTVLSARVVEMEDRLPAGCLGIIGQEILNLFDFSFEPGAPNITLVPCSRPGG
jgi:hypothetical protein